MYHRLLIIIFHLTLLLGAFQVAHAWSIEKTSINTDSAKIVFHTVVGKMEKMYGDMWIWYQKNNRPVTVLPYILRVHILDFFAVLLGILLAFWMVIRFLSR